MQAVGRGEVIQFRIPGNTRYVSMVRCGIRSIAHNVNLSDEATSDIELSVSEAIANAIEHGSPEKSDNVVVVTCRVDADKLIIDVRDEGPGFELVPDSRSDPDALREHGRGLHLICELMDSVQYSRMRKGSKLRMVKRTGSAADREQVAA